MILNATADPAACERFLELPDELYRDDPCYRATPRDAVSASLGRQRFQGRQAALVEVDDGRTVARLVARLSPKLKGSDGRPLGMLGLFEAHDEPEQVSELFRAAVGWLREQGAGDIVGPIDGDTWHSYRLNVGPFDERPFLLEPYNRPYFPALWKAAGFRPLENYYSKRVEGMAAAAGKLQPILDRVLARGYELRMIDMSCFEDELAIIHRLSVAIFAENLLYEGISLEDFLPMYVPFKSLIDAELVRIAMSPQGEPVGFVFSIVDYHKAAATAADAVNVKSLGVHASHRKSGLGAALTCQAYRDIAARGCRRANLCLIREGNPSGRLDAGQGTIFRRYILYQYSPELRHD